MKLHLTYCSSDNGVKTIRLFKYIMRKQHEHEHEHEHAMTFSKNEFCLTDSQLDIEPAMRKIYGYDNIRIALKSIFPTMIDLTLTKRIPLAHLSLEHVRKINRIE